MLRYAVVLLQGGLWLRRLLLVLVLFAGLGQLIVGAMAVALYFSLLGHFAEAAAAAAVMLVAGLGMIGCERLLRRRFFG